MSACSKLALCWGLVGHPPLSGPRERKTLVRGPRSNGTLATGSPPGQPFVTWARSWLPLRARPEKAFRRPLEGEGRGGREGTPSNPCRSLSLEGPRCPSTEREGSELQVGKLDGCPSAQPRWGCMKGALGVRTEELACPGSGWGPPRPHLLQKPPRKPPGKPPAPFLYPKPLF